MNHSSGAASIAEMCLFEQAEQEDFSIVDRHFANDLFHLILMFLAIFL
jgi:hypothetical protein